MFYPDLVAADITSPVDTDHDDQLTAAVRTLHKEGRYIVTGPEGITKHRFMGATDAPTRRRKQIRSVPRKP